ncbi:MAG TPA: response regulator transcription factor [Anaerolineales bacterium]|nr:response regulator transcription factor [Anaerolineales bacterium]
MQAIEFGADDFLPKPFSAQILLARVKALLRRNGHENGIPSALKYDDGRLAIDTERRQILINGKRVKAGPTAFRLLVYLEQNAGQTVTYDQLLANVWSEEGL